ncbi:hypothetical protein C5810_005091 [Salmonella enterica subsp. enterica serovar Monschaui]|nr:hypothetical protein [Salmonella enterica]EDV1680773.1 hypothetical protein [Salmonella enterica subsp. enterica serovar Monschaui]EDX3322161.1 hypothetical protein [Salmonella enterica subsp. enterica serovar Anatum]EJB7764826.1 hypothetical protein [Salmonella enterica]
MALKTTLDNLDGLPDAVAALYIPTEGGRYRLDLEQPEPTEKRLGDSIATGEMVRLLDSHGANGDLLAVHLAHRVKAVVDDSGAVKINYYTENGNPQTSEAFAKEIVNNPKYARLVTGSKAGGNGGYVNNGAGHQQQNPRLDITGGRLTRARDILANGSR